MRRIPDILDVWFDSGVAALHTETGFEKNNSSLVLCEALDQIRGWFTSLSVLSYITKGALPYQKVFCHGYLMQSKYKKISKSTSSGLILIQILNKESNPDKLLNLKYELLRRTHCESSSFDLQKALRANSGLIRVLRGHKHLIQSFFNDE